MHKHIIAIATTLAIAVAPATAIAQATKPADTPQASGTAKVTFYNAKASNQHLASTYIGAPVRNRQNEEIGDVNDAVIDEGGKVAALVVGVGGFLGVGEKDVAVGLESVTVEEDENKNIVVKIDASKQQLENAESFKVADSGETLSERWERLQKSISEQTQSIQKQMSGEDKKKQ